MKYLFSISFLLFSIAVFAQPKEEPLQVVEQMPMFPGCQDSTGTSAELKQCSDQKMLQFIYQNITYPEVDRANGNEGTVVVNFVVEKDGSISNPKIVRDLGEKLGEEALRVVKLMNEMPERWTPGMQSGEPVRVSFNLPVKFKLETVEEPEFVLAGRDTVWIRFDKPAVYEGGDEALIKYIDEEIIYPEAGQDSCRIGVVEINLLVKTDGSVSIMDLIDYSNLGIDYQFEAIKLMNATTGRWTPAYSGERPVNTSFNIRIVFRPNVLICGDKISDFQIAEQLANEGALLIEAQKEEEGIAKLTEALDLFPDNGEYLSLRGQAYITLQKTEEACLDLKRAKEIMVVSWYDALIPLLCK